MCTAWPREASSTITDSNSLTYQKFRIEKTMRRGGAAARSAAPIAFLASEVGGGWPALPLHRDVVAGQPRRAHRSEDHHLGHTTHRAVAQHRQPPQRSHAFGRPPHAEMERAQHETLDREARGLAEPRPQAVRRPLHAGFPIAIELEAVDRSEER